MYTLRFIGYLLVAIAVFVLFLVADRTAKDNLPPTLHDELEKVIARYGNARTHAVRADRARDPRSVYPRGAERIEQSV